MDWTVTGPYPADSKAYVDAWFRHNDGCLWWWGGKEDPTHFVPKDLSAGAPEHGFQWSTEAEHSELRGAKPGGSYYVAHPQTTPNFSKLTMPKSHPVGVNPPHYTRTPIEPFDVIEAWQETWPPGIRFHLASAIKYLARLGAKDGATPVMDLKKAITYLDRAHRVLVEGRGQK